MVRRRVRSPPWQTRPRKGPTRKFAIVTGGGRGLGGRSVRKHAAPNSRVGSAAGRSLEGMVGDSMASALHFLIPYGSRKEHVGKESWSSLQLVEMAIAPPRPVATTRLDEFTGPRSTSTSLRVGHSKASACGSYSRSTSTRDSAPKRTPIPGSLSALSRTTASPGRRDRKGRHPVVRFGTPDKRRRVLVLGRPDVLPSLNEVPVLPNLDPGPPSSVAGRSLTEADSVPSPCVVKP